MAFHRISHTKLQVGDRINRDVGSNDEYTVVQIADGRPQEVKLQDSNGEQEWTVFTPDWPVNLIYPKGSLDENR